MSIQRGLTCSAGVSTLNLMSSLKIPDDFAPLIQRQKSVFARIAGGLGGQLVIMGTGELGRVMGQRLQQLPIEIKCFCDNNPKKQGSTFLGRPTLSVAEAVKQ